MPPPPPGPPPPGQPPGSRITTDALAPKEPAKDAALAEVPLQAGPQTPPPSTGGGDAAAPASSKDPLTLYLEGYGYAVADGGEWRKQPDGQGQGRGTNPQVSFQVEGHHEEDGHTLYMLECSLVSQGLHHLEWLVQRRLRDLKNGLLEPVKEELRGSYAEHFKGVPFADKNSFRRTFASLKAWLATLASLINTSVCTPGLVACVLQFLEAPKPPTLARPAAVAAIPEAPGADCGATAGGKPAPSSSPEAEAAQLAAVAPEGAAARTGTGGGGSAPMTPTPGKRAKRGLSQPRPESPQGQPRRGLSQSRPENPRGPQRGPGQSRPESPLGLPKRGLSQPRPESPRGQPAQWLQPWIRSWKGGMPSRPQPKRQQLEDAQRGGAAAAAGAAASRTWMEREALVRRTAHVYSRLLEGSLALEGPELVARVRPHLPTIPSLLEVLQEAEDAARQEPHGQEAGVLNEAHADAARVAAGCNTSELLQQGIARLCIDKDAQRLLSELRPEEALEMLQEVDSHVRNPSAYVVAAARKKVRRSWT